VDMNDTFLLDGLCVLIGHIQYKLVIIWFVVVVVVGYSGGDYCNKQLPFLVPNCHGFLRFVRHLSRRDVKPGGLVSNTSTGRRKKEVAEIRRPFPFAKLLSGDRLLSATALSAIACAEFRRRRRRFDGFAPSGFFGTGKCLINQRWLDLHQREVDRSVIRVLNLFDFVFESKHVIH
jgi:hypothetical protein